jgi:drug/metabolite transporter (DMT)-like permease
MSLFPLNRKTGALLSVLLIVTVWGSASSVTKVAVENIPPYVFAFLRNLVASVCLLIFYLYRRKKNLQQRVDAPLKTLIWMGLTGISFFYVFFNLGLYYTTASAGALIQGFIPVAITLLAIVFLKEKLKSIQGFGILLSVAGVIMIGFIGTIPEARNNLLGNVLIIIAVLSWGVYTVISKSMQSYDPVYLTAMSTWIGTACLIPAVLIEYWNKPFIPVISLAGWAAILYLGIMSSAVCYILYNQVMKTLSAVQVGSFMNLDPVAGAIIAVIFLDERVTAWQIGGTVLVLVGVGLSSGRREKK